MRIHCEAAVILFFVLSDAYCYELIISPSIKYPVFLRTHYFTIYPRTSTILIFQALLPSEVHALPEQESSSDSDLCSDSDSSSDSDSGSESVDSRQSVRC